MRKIECNKCREKKNVWHYGNIRYRVCNKCSKVARKEREKKHPERIKAKQLVGDAIKRGVLVREEECSKCGNGNKRIIAHHEDYSRPLCVVWLCDLCHQKLHRSKRGRGITL